MDVHFSHPFMDGLLPSRCLQDLTYVELGTNVRFTGVVPNLRRSASEEVGQE